ncbi:MAG: hypothetical protein Q8K60_04465 [Parachlamydiaceae bacterium]|nr:hypothetical protein [Parachlamydiaceae bacterium]
MRFFESKLSFVLFLISIPLLFMPKINLINVGNETAGLRFDDLFLLTVAALIMLTHGLSRKKLYNIEGWILILTGFSILSFLSNRFLVSLQVVHLDAKVFYAVRLLEYFMFFYIGTMAFQFDQKGKIIRFFFLWNFFLMILQKLNLAGAVTVLGYDADVSSRAQGIASFPSEMGLLLNLMFCYLIYDPAPARMINLFSSPMSRHFLRKSYLYWMFTLFSILVIFTGNRISLLALLLCFLCRMKQQFNFRSISSIIMMSILIPIVIATSAFVITKTAAIYHRSAGLFSLNNLELAVVVWQEIDLEKDPVGNEVISSQDYDASWWMRIHKWIHVIKAFVSNPSVYLQGLGPGYAWSALDGGVLRIIIENGLIGAFFYWKFFSHIYRINTQTRWMCFAFFLNLIFFDAYLAYKTMSFFLFAVGHCFQKELQQQKLQKDMIALPLPAKVSGYLNT